jgi:hypothetical protein
VRNRPGVSFISKGVSKDAYDYQLGESSFTGKAHPASSNAPLKGSAFEGVSGGWGNVLMLGHSHQDPSCRVLYVLKPLQALARDPAE